MFANDYQRGKANGELIVDVLATFSGVGLDEKLVSVVPKMAKLEKIFSADEIVVRPTKVIEGSGKAVNLSDELVKSGVKYNPNDVVAITKTADGKLVWLENGSKQAGLEHIMNHADDFAAKGIARGEIKDLVMTALEKGEIVGYQGKGTGRPIYEVVFKGEKQRVAITVGNNGFVVGANPQSLP